jgi:hypothetical protein
MIVNCLQPALNVRPDQEAPAFGLLAMTFVGMAGRGPCISNRGRVTLTTLTPRLQSATEFVAATTSVPTTASRSVRDDVRNPAPHEHPRVDHPAPAFLHTGFSKSERHKAAVGSIRQGGQP